MASTPEILFVDDSKTVRCLAEKILGEKYSVYICTDGEEAWDKLRTTLSIKIVFTDINMQGMNGTELLKNIRESSNSRIATMPVIMITGSSDTESNMRKVFELGATDFIAKPFKSMDLLSRAYSYIRLSDQVNSLEHQLGIDKLTGLLSKTSMVHHADKFLAFASRHNTPFSIAYLDITRFDEMVNEYGNSIAMKILTTISGKLQSKVRNEDVAARVDFNRFAILLPVCSIIRAQVSVQRVINDIHKIVFKLGGKSLQIKVFAGITSTDINCNKVSIVELLSQASRSVDSAAQHTNRDLIAYNEISQSITFERDVSNLELTESINHILEGRFDRVSDEHANLLQRKMKEFFDNRAVSTLRQTR